MLILLTSYTNLPEEEHIFSIHKGTEFGQSESVEQDLVSPQNPLLQKGVELGQSESVEQASGQLEADPLGPHHLMDAYPAPPVRVFVPQLP